MTNGLDSAAARANTWDSAQRGFFLSPYDTSAADYAAARAGAASYQSGAQVAPAVIKIPMNTVAPYLRSTTGANGELEYYIAPEFFDQIPASAFTPHG